MRRFAAVRIVSTGVLALAFSTAAFAQTIWYVDVHATPPGLGTPANPFTSIQYAIDRPTTVAGDTVLVAPGNYLEKLVIAKEITVKSSSGPLSTIVLPSGTGDGISLAGSVDNTVLAGFTVTATTPWSGVYVVYGTVRGCIVRDCTSQSGIECVFARIESTTVIRNNFGVLGQPFNGSIEIRNSIVWENASANVAVNSWALTANYNAGFGSPTNGNVPGDPDLWNLAEGDVHLRPGSPCINAGDPASPPDPDGSRIDIGALTYDPSYAPGPTPYCTGKLNSQGCIPAIGGTGTASATSTGPFTITAANEVPNKPGLLFFGFGKRAEPFQGGVHCVQLPIKRVGVQNSGGSGPCGGSFAFDMQAYIQSGVHPGLVPGALVYGQWWSRDFFDPAGYGSSLSDALYFGIAP